MSGQQQTKRAASVLDYEFDFAALTNGTGTENWLQSGETIASIDDVTVETGITLGTGANAPVTVNGATGVRVWLSGGTVGKTYKVSCTINTSSNPARTDTKTMYVTVTQ